MPKIKINDISMYYETYGQGEPIIFISGFGADHTIWYEVVNQLKQSYQVIVFDNRGAGQTDVPKGDYSIKQMADDVFALCVKLKIQQAHFVGNSLGGFILQLLALHYPNLVKSAIISNSAHSAQCGFHVYVAAQLELIKANVPLALLAKASCAWAFSYQFLSKPGMLDTLIRKRLDNPYPFSIDGYEGQYAAISEFDSSIWANQIDVPTLVVGSDQDLVFTEASTHALAKHIPKAKYYCFTECGHLPQLEYPEQFAKVILNFIT